MAKKMKYQPNTDKASWEDESKEQIHLGMGSAEYRELIEDLQEVQPFAPDDEAHAKMEAYNEALAAHLNEQSQSEHEVEQYKYRRKMQKEAVLAHEKEDLRKMAASTPTPKDDAVVESLGNGRALQKSYAGGIFNDAVSADDIESEGYVPKALRKYL